MWNAHGRCGLYLFAGPVDSQKMTSVLPATLTEVRVAWKVRHSAWVAVAMLSPVQAVGIRCPVAVHPGPRFPGTTRG